MSRESIFKSAVKDLLPNSIPVELDRVDEFNIGKVLIFKKKPKLIPTRKHNLEFTEWSLESLLAEGQEIDITTTSTYLYDSEVGTSSFNLNVNLEADVDLSKLFQCAGGSIGIKGGENKVFTMKTDFGKISHLSSDLTKLVLGKKFVLNADHPLVKKARERGGSLFIIHTIYQAEHCNIDLKVSTDKEETAEESASLAAKESGSESVEDKASCSKVITRDQPTPISYLVLKADVDSKGNLSSKLESSLFSRLRVGTEYTDSSAKPNPFNGWVVVENDTSQPAKIEPDPKTESKVQSVEAEAAAAPDQAVQRTVEEVFVAAPTHSTLSATPTAPLPLKRAVEYDLDQHGLYSLRDFQPFLSKTYHGVLDEVKEWVGPLHANPKLRAALIAYTKPPQTYERLNDLSSFFLEMGDALRAGKPAPPSKLSNVQPILDALSEDKNRRLNEISSVIVVAEAGDDFPQHIVQKIVELEQDKRETLQQLILDTPYDTEIHAYPDVGPYNDGSLKPILSRMGFKLASGGNNLQFNRRLVEEEDLLTAVLILLKASE